MPERLRAAPDEHDTAAALARLRPDLVAAFAAALPGARAAVLARLWGAIAREPIVGVAGRRARGDRFVVTLADGRRLRGPGAECRPFAVPANGLTLDLEDARHADPARLLAALRLPTDTSALQAELANSVANLALARAAAKAPAGTKAASRAGSGAGDELTHQEQSIMDGHPLHPCCRTRIGLSTEDVLRYAPEHRPIVNLVEVAVSPERWHTTGAKVPPRLPVHPWQLPRLLEAGAGVPTGRMIPARPLMSLRTLAPIHDRRYHLKTAVDVQMTSAVRTVSPAAVHNGPLLSRLLVELTEKTPGLEILREPAAAAVLVDGEPSPSFATVWREAPRLGPDETALPLAAYANHLCLVDVDPQRATAAFHDLVRLLLPPLLTLLHLGVALEAHGQNTLVVLRDGRPVRVLYRDMGGVRVSPRRLARAGLAAPPLRGDLVDDDPETLRTKLFAAVLSTVVTELVAVQVRRYRVAPEPLWDRVAAVVGTAYAELPVEARTDAAALFANPLPVKAMTAMRLADRPVDDIWTRLPNPLTGLR